LISSEWVKASVTPFKTLAPSVSYGYKWWLYAYGSDNSKFVWSGNGFGGQFPIVIPEYNIVAVVNAWNIQGGQGLGVRTFINHLVNAVKK
jgi:CubicO group peptidase (beta-lactamase class C family)